MVPNGTVADKYFEDIADFTSRLDRASPVFTTHITLLTILLTFSLKIIVC